MYTCKCPDTFACAFDNEMNFELVLRLISVITDGNFFHWIILINEINFYLFIFNILSIFFISKIQCIINDCENVAYKMKRMYEEKKIDFALFFFFASFQNAGNHLLCWFSFPFVLSVFLPSDSKHKPIRMHQCWSIKWCTC